jgi:hypothetical protein
MAKLNSFNKECLSLGFEEEFLSFKHLHSQSQTSTLRKKVASFRESTLAAIGVSFGTEI